MTHLVSPCALLTWSTGRTVGSTAEGAARVPGQRSGICSPAFAQRRPLWRACCALRTSADPEIRTLDKLLEFIGAVNGGWTSAQVALNYLVRKGAIPIPSCTSVARADAIADVLEFELGVEDIETIDEKMDYIERKS